MTGPLSDKVKRTLDENVIEGELVPTPAESQQLVKQEPSALERLTPQQRYQAKKMAQAIKPNDTSSVLNFGTEAQRKLRTDISPMLRGIAIKDAGPGGQLLGELVLRTKGVEPSSLRKRYKFRAAKRITDAIKSFIERYKSVEAEIAQLEHDLRGAMEELLGDIKALDRVYASNAEFRQQLLIYIEAGNYRLEQLRKEVADLRLEAAHTNNAEIAQEVKDLEIFIGTLERKVHDFELTQTGSLQAGPQIRVVQAGNRDLYEKIDSVILNVIPIWMMGMALAVSILKQQGHTAVLQQVADSTNNLLKNNAMTLEQSAAELARQTERGVIDFETLEFVTEKLVSTLEETQRIHDEGAQRRVQEVGQLRQIEEKLNAALTGPQKSQGQLPY